MDIQKIKRKRMNLRTKIRGYIKEGKDVSDLYIEYENILEKLRQLGVNVSTKNTTKYLIQKKTNDLIKPEIECKNKSQNYQLTLAWTNDLNFNIEHIKNYIKEIGLQLLDEEYNDIFGNREYLIKYIYNGNDESFKVLKKSINFILNMFPNNNIEVYGKQSNEIN